MRRLLPVLLTALLAVAAPARADAPWSAPQDLSTPHLFVDAPHLLLGGDGGALATWVGQDGTGNAGRSAAYGAFRATGTPAFAPERRLSGSVGGLQLPAWAGPPATYGRSRALVLTQQAVAGTRDTTRLGVAFGSTRGTFGAARTLAVQPGLHAPVLAADAAGDAAVAWWQDRGVTNDRVFVALRKPGGRFGAPVLLGTGRIRSVSVAVSPRGDTLVAWDARGSIHARLRRAGHGFGAEETIRSASTYYASIHTAVTARGRAYIAWTAQLLTEGGDRGPFTAEVAVRPVGATRFRAAQLLESQARTAAQAGADLLLTGEDASFAWAGLYAGKERIRVAETGAAARFGGVQDVSPAGVGAADPTLAAGPAGERVLAWSQGDGDSGGRIVAAFAPAGGAFGGPELVSAGPEARQPDAIFAPGGAPTLVWSNRPAGSRGPIAGIRTYAQAATRAG